MVPRLLEQIALDTRAAWKAFRSLIYRKRAIDPFKDPHPASVSVEAAKSP